MNTFESKTRESFSQRFLLIDTALKILFSFNQTLST